MSPLLKIFIKEITVTTSVQPQASVSRNVLETVGKKLADFTKNNTLSKNALTPLDIASIKADFKNNKNAFHDHIPRLSRKLLGKTPVARYSSLASHVLPKNTFEKVTDTAFIKIGQLAQGWAQFDLEHDKRFANRNLDDSERHALAKAIANQNRSLATVGSISNLTGLPGILVDTLWLLTISLRSIFQIAHIYDKPLTGKQGIAIAYEVLAKTDLNKLQEKQTLLAGLGVFEAVADDGFSAYRLDNQAANEDTSDEDYGQVQGMFSKVEEIANSLNVNLSGFNFSFLHKILPISAVGIGATYNNIIIHEVVELALATFAPTPKLAVDSDKADNKASEEKDAVASKKD